MAVLKAEHIEKTFWDSNQKLRVLTDINLIINKGEFACISGKSGCGKSTLLHILGLLDTPDTGNIFYNGEIIKSSSTEAALLRNRLIGFVFQFHYLIDDLTTLENVALPLMVAGIGKKDSLIKAMEMLEKLDIHQRQGHFPYQLSGGEQQRAALGRALITNPAIILADEPTGNLDPGHSREVLELFHKFNRESECSFLLVTHDPVIANQADNHYEIKDGLLQKALT